MQQRRGKATPYFRHTNASSPPICWSLPKSGERNYIIFAALEPKAPDSHPKDDVPANIIEELGH